MIGGFSIGNAPIGSNGQSRFIVIVSFILKRTIRSYISASNIIKRTIRAFVGTISCVSQWHLNEASWNGTPNEVIDSKGLNNGVAVNGATTDAGGKLNRCGYFSATTKYALIPNDILDLTKDFSIEFWANMLSSGSSNYRLFSLINTGAGAGNIQIGYKGSKTIFVRFANLSKETVNTINYGEWYHIVFTYTASGSVWNLLINNVSKTLQSSSAPSANAQFSAIGGGYSSLNTKGYVDEVRVYDRVLSSAEIGFVYNSGNGREMVHYVLRRTIRNFVSQSTIIQRIIRSFVSQSSIIKRSIRSFVEQSAIIKRSILNFISKSFILKRSILNFISKSVLLKRTIRNYISKSVIIKRTIRNFVDKSVIIKRTIREYVSSTLTLKRTIREFISITLTLKRRIRVWMGIVKPDAPSYGGISKPTTNYNAITKPDDDIWTDVDKPLS